MLLVVVTLMPITYALGTVGQEEDSQGDGAAWGYLLSAASAFFAALDCVVFEFCVKYNMVGAKTVDGELARSCAAHELLRPLYATVLAYMFQYEKVSAGGPLYGWFGPAWYSLWGGVLGSWVSFNLFQKIAVVWSGATMFAVAASLDTFVCYLFDVLIFRVTPFDIVALLDLFILVITVVAVITHNHQCMQQVFIHRETASGRSSKRESRK